MLSGVWLDDGRVAICKCRVWFDTVMVLTHYKEEMNVRKRFEADNDVREIGHRRGKISNRQLLQNIQRLT